MLKDIIINVAKDNSLFITDFNGHVAIRCTVEYLSNFIVQVVGQALDAGIDYMEIQRQMRDMKLDGHHVSNLFYWPNLEK